MHASVFGIQYEIDANDTRRQPCNKIGNMRFQEAAVVQGAMEPRLKLETQKTS